MTSAMHAPPAASANVYDDRTIHLHWVTAVIVALLWGIAEVIDLFPRGAPKIAVRSVHVILGLLLVAVAGRRVPCRIWPGNTLSLSGALLGAVGKGNHPHP